MKTLLEMRKELGWSQKKFANYLGISVRTIQNWEQNRREPPEYLTMLVERVLIKENVLEEKKADNYNVATRCIKTNEQDVGEQVVKHGTWYGGRCTHCGWEMPDRCSYYGYDDEPWKKTPYCPNCGAEMDESVEEVRNLTKEEIIFTDKNKLSEYNCKLLNNFINYLNERHKKNRDVFHCGATVQICSDEEFVTEFNNFIMNKIFDTKK